MSFMNLALEKVPHVGAILEIYQKWTFMTFRLFSLIALLVSCIQNQMGLNEPNLFKLQVRSAHIKPLNLY